MIGRDKAAPDEFDTARAAPALAETVAFRLLTAANHLARPFREELGRSAGVSLTEWRCILALASVPGGSGEDVAERMGLERMTTSRTLRQLEGRGLAIRRSDPANRKRYQWCLTDSGWTVADRIAPLARARDEALFGHVTLEDRAALDRVLSRVGLSPAMPVPRVLPAGDAPQGTAAAMWEADAASRWLGMTLDEVTEGAARLTLTVAPHHLNGHGTCHGGVIFALADSAFAYACNTQGKATATMHALATFLAPTRESETLTATAREIALEGRNGIYDVEVAGPAGPVAQFRGMSRTLVRRAGSELPT